MNLRSDLRVIAELVPEGSRILDLGCADGELLEFLIEKKKARGSGIELSEKGVLACVRRGLSVRQGNIAEGLADYPDGSLDVVILSQTLPFLNNPADVINEMLRVGTCAIISFPNWGYWRCRLEFLVTGRVPQYPGFEQQWDGEKRWQLFTLADFEDIVQWIGVEIDDRAYLKENQRIKKRPSWRARTAVYALTKADK
ncbi:MAG: methionine biosynthesis protein MetW [Cellvibrionaceae bacterium]|jgi:methionine biosynthesis protein MetW